MFVFLRSSYDWVLAKSEHRFAGFFLSVIAFCESIFFPIPPDIMLIPMCVGNRKKAFLYAFLCMVFSSIGGATGYIIGYYFYDAIGAPLIAFYQMEDVFSRLQSYFQVYGLWFVAISGFTPVPYKVFAIGSGFLHFAFLPFLVVSACSRGMRFFLVSLLVYWLGPPIRTFVDRYFNILSVVFVVLLVGFYFLLTYL